MPVAILNERLWFPPADEAEPDGLLAMGGDLSIERLLLAYRNGIFPWFNDNIPLWWNPDPRFVLFPVKIKKSKSMQQLLKKNAFDFRINTSFTAVIDNCSSTPRPGQDGTWITEDVKQAYIGLHRLGYAHSAEAWKENKLVGGLYGVRLGKVFFGESMFSAESNASKYAFVKYTEQLIDEGVELVDCQVYTSHLESLGAEMIPRKRFINFLNRLITS